MMLDLIRDIQQCEPQIVMAVTGGGTQAISELVRHGGGSRVLIEGIIPYSYKSLARLVGEPPLHACSEETAELMAVGCYQRAIDYGCDPNNAVGVAATCVLRKQNERSGREHKMHLGITQDCLGDHHRTTLITADFAGHQNRQQQEHTAAFMILYNLSCVLQGQKPDMSMLFATSEYVVGQIKEQLLLLSESDRQEAFEDYCKSCYRHQPENGFCHCWNDE